MIYNDLYTFVSVKEPFWKNLFSYWVVLYSDNKLYLLKKLGFPFEFTSIS